MIGSRPHRNPAQGRERALARTPDIAKVLATTIARAIRTELEVLSASLSVSRAVAIRPFFLALPGF